VRLLTPPDDDDDDDDSEVITDPITHFESFADALFEYALRNVEDTDVVGVVIQNENNEKTLIKVNL
jgi:hypothetical protein